MRKVVRAGCLSIVVVSLATVLYVWANLWTLRESMMAKATARLHVRSTPVAGSIHMIEAVGEDGRRRGPAIAASVGPDGVLLVDTLHSGAAPRLRKVLSDLGGSKIRFIFNTHFHLDHVGGIEDLREGADVVAHTNVHKRLSAPQRSFPIRAYPAQPQKLPDQTFAESFSLSFNGEEVRAIHVPRAHTDADVVVYFTAAKVLVTGDIYNGAGRLSTPSTLQGGDARGLLAALDELCEWLPEDVRIVPGHGRTGAVSTLRELEEYVELMTQTLEMVETKIARGQILEEIVTEGLPEAWREWPDQEAAVDEWIQSLHHHLKPKTNASRTN